MIDEIDLRKAMNYVSDVIQNRPRPLREFDQIYMKAGDMVMQSEFIARWAHGRRVAFIGDGDAIGTCVQYLRAREVLPYGPAHVTIFDFDERICNSVLRFADQQRLSDLEAQLYNCLDPFPATGRFDCFYTNPPWGASNEGESVKVFMQRGMEAVAFRGEGTVVVADDPSLAWPAVVLRQLQSSALESNFHVQRMMPQVHSYHLDDAPELRSCNVIIKGSAERPATAIESLPIRDPSRLRNFYGRETVPQVRYVREREHLNYGKANESEYSLELLEAP